MKKISMIFLLLPSIFIWFMSINIEKPIAIIFGVCYFITASIGFVLCAKFRPFRLWWLIISFVIAIFTILRHEMLHPSFANAYVLIALLIFIIPCMLVAVFIVLADLFIKDYYKNKKK